MASSADNSPGEVTISYKGKETVMDIEDLTADFVQKSLGLPFT